MVETRQFFIYKKMMFNDINFLKFKFKKLKRMISLPRNWLVLDVGSGDGPFPRADVLFDKYVFDTDRMSNLVIDRPFVMGDISALPFLDNSFDFVYCSHVLEHINNPEIAMKEMMRVGKRGYIELPSEFREKIQSTAVHKYFVRKEDNCLLFYRKEKDVFDDCLQGYFRDLIDKKDKTYLSFYFKHYYDLFNLEYYWDKEIKFKILDKPDVSFNGENVSQSLKQIIAQLDKTSSSFSVGLRSMLKVFVRKLFTKVKNADLIRFLACPYCKKNVIVTERKDFKCTACNREFQVHKNIPIMLNGIPYE